MIVAVNNKKHNTRMVFFPHLSMLGWLAITLIITIPQLSQQHHTCLAFAVAATSAASASSSSSSSSFALSGSNSHGRRRSTSTSSSRSMQHIEEDKQQQQRAEQDETKQEAPAADTDTDTETTLLDLHSAQTRGSPAQTLHDLATFCENDGIDTFDVYGDFSSSKTSSSSHSEEEASSYLRAFESEIATTFGKQDAVFMPSGVMAQSIALLIHASSSSSSQISSSSPSKNKNNSACSSNGNRNNEEQSKRKQFACHRTSHLLLHENEGYSDLLHMDAVILPLEEPTPIGGIVGGTYAAPPMRFHDVQALFSSRMPDAEAGATTQTTRTKKPQQQHHERLSCLMLELPHRELGGKLTPYEEVVAMSRLCRTHGVAFHCDGARIFEAAAGYTILSNKKKNNNDGGGDISVQEIAQQFDSIYISCYKGLGGLSGAMLLGDVQFCNEARIWLRRFGGNLYTLLPYVVAAKRGYRLHVDDNKNGSTRKNSNSNSSSNNDNMLMMMSFKSKTEKLQRIVQSITCNDDNNDDNDDDNDATFDAAAVVTFDPKIPATNMVHGYIRASFDECHNAIAAIEASLGVTILNRVRPISKEQEQHEYKKGYRCRFEWTMGDSNGTIEDAIFITAWKEFIRILSS